MTEKNKIIVEFALIGRYEAKNDYFRLSITAFPDRDTFFDQRLIDQFFQLGNHFAQIFQGHDDFRRHQARPQSLDNHDFKTVLPFMLSYFFRQQL